jgi:hypothetical protein
MSSSEVLCTADELLGSYALVSELASGHLTTLHRAHVAGSAGGALVIKRLLYSHVHETADRELLLAAGRAAMRVRSPHVARVLSVHEDPEPFLVMEHVTGVPLSTLLEETLDREVLRYVFPILVDVLMGLEAMHELRDATGGDVPLVHGAPSARHILIGDDGVARLVDFTHATYCTRSLAGADTRASTGPGFSVAARRSLRLQPAEMAPEQVLAPMHIDTRCDLFIVGTVLWRALTGQPLFQHEQREEALRQLLKKPILAPSEAGSPLGKRFDRICLRALARVRADRYGSAAEMARELKVEAERASLYASREEIASLVRTLVLANEAGDGERTSATPVTSSSEDRADEGDAIKRALAQDPSDSEPSLDILTVHHQGSSAFGFARSAAHEAVTTREPNIEAPASTREQDNEPSAHVAYRSRIESHFTLSEPIASVLSAEAPTEARSSREWGTWYEGLPSIVPIREPRRTSLASRLLGGAGAAALLAGLVLANQSWERRGPTHERRLSTASTADATGAAGYAAFFASPMSVRSSALPPRHAADVADVSPASDCAPPPTAAAVPTPESGPDQSSLHTVSTFAPARIVRPKAPKPVLSPLPPNPY